MRALGEAARRGVADSAGPQPIPARNSSIDTVADEQWRTAVSPRAPDFGRLFAAGARHDFRHFRTGCVVTVRIKPVATLHLPSGRLVACEPWTSFDDQAGSYAFTQRVEPGDYWVELIIADFYDPGNPQGNTRFSEVAAARLVVRREPVAAWRMALRPGENDADLPQDGFFGYPVDGGMGSFASPEFLDAISTPEQSEELSEVVMDVIDADDVGLFSDEATGYNIVMFRSGGGDGHYGTWVGYTAGGEVACFATDFMTLTASADVEEGEPGPQSPVDPQPPLVAQPPRPAGRIAGTPSRGVAGTRLVSGAEGTAIRPTAKAAKGTAATPAERRVLPRDLQ